MQANHSTIANQIWYSMIRNIAIDGESVRCRGHEIRELMDYHCVIPMVYPLVTLKDRKLGYKFCCAEAAWILSGDNRVETMKPFSKTIENFSDDGVHFFGAYGPKIVDQLPYIFRAFEKDIYTRQAVMTIWRERPYDSKDVPCTVSIQFMYRNGRLHVFDKMRSSDAWLGVPYDWFNFSMLGAYVAIEIGRRLGMPIQLGNLYFSAVSEHLYVGSYGYTLNDALKIRSDVTAFEYAPLDIYEFDTGQELIDHLWSVANRRSINFHQHWLTETYQIQGVDHGKNT